MRRLSLLLALGAWVVVGCGGSTTPATSTTTDAGGSDVSTSNDSATTTSGSDDSGAETTGTPPLATAGISGIALNPSDEKTVCITMRLHNAAPIMATKITATLEKGSHHLIIYRSSDTTENLTPTSCPPLSGILTGSIPMMISQISHDELDFPANVGLKLEANQMVKIEAHYINTGTTPITGAGHFDIEGIWASAAPPSMQEAEMMFWGTKKIDIAAHSTFATPVNFKPAFAGTHGFATTTHQHRLGTRMRIWTAKDATDAAAITDATTPIADSKAWDAAPLYRLSPTVDFDGTNGLAYKCEWNNTTDAPVSFGESALSEMCFLWMYYYPSHGFQVCLDGLCY